MPLLWAVCVFVFVPCAVSVFSSAHCCLPSPPLLSPHHLVPLPAVPASLSDLYPGPRRQADTFTIHARLQYLMAKFVVAVAVTTPQCGTVAGADNVTVWQWGTLVRQSQSLLSSSYSSPWRCLVAISLSFRFGKLFFRLPCAPFATPLWLLLTVSLGIAGCCLLLAVCLLLAAGAMLTVIICCP